LEEILALEGDALTDVTTYARHQGHLIGHVGQSAEEPHLALVLPELRLCETNVTAMF